jgi:hypothetical protein
VLHHARKQAQHSTPLKVSVKKGASGPMDIYCREARKPLLGLALGINVGACLQLKDALVFGTFVLQCLYSASNGRTATVRNDERPLCEDKSAHRDRTGRHQAATDTGAPFDPPAIAIVR